MHRLACFLRATLSVASVVVLSAGCAVLCPDHAVRSTMTLAPGQTVFGRLAIPGGGKGLAQFQRESPRKGVPPYPEATTWTGDGEVLIAFPDSTLPEEYRLGYAHQWLVDGRVCRVVVRNATFHPTTFTWTLTGSSDAFADWDLTESGAPP